MDTINTETVTHSGRAHRDLDSLRRTVAGRVYVPDDPEWDRVRAPWARTVEQTPLAVLEVADAEDVRHAVRWAVENGRQVTAQPVGTAPTTRWTRSCYCAPGPLIPSRSIWTPVPPPSEPG